MTRQTTEGKTFTPLCSQHVGAREKNSRFRRQIALCLTLAPLLGLLLFSQACGKKDWPAPIAAQERFVWSEISAQTHGRCLDITALVSGKVQNLASLTLEVESRPDACPGCPFTPDTTIDMPPGSDAWNRRGGLVHVTWCKLPPDRAVRWRLVGHSVYSGMPDAVSTVHSLDRTD